MFAFVSPGRQRYPFKRDRALQRDLQCRLFDGVPVPFAHVRAAIGIVEVPLDLRDAMVRR